MTICYERKVHEKWYIDLESYEDYLKDHCFLPEEEINDIFENLKEEFDNYEKEDFRELLCNDVDGHVELINYESKIIE